MRPPTLPWPPAAVDCPACGACWRERTARFCGHCGAALQTPEPAGRPDRPDGPARAARAIPTMAIVVVALVGVGLTLGVADLPTFGIGRPDDIALPGEAAADDLAVPQRDLTDPAGQPRCHTDTYAFDCVTGSFSFGLGQLHSIGGHAGRGFGFGFEGGQATGGRADVELVAGAFGIAAVDAADWEVVWRWSAEGRRARAWTADRDDLVLASDGEALVALDRRTGEPRWRQEDVDGAFGDMWVLAQPDAPVLVRSQDVDSARLTAFDPADGGELWTARIGGDDHPTVGAAGTVILMRHQGASAHPDLRVLDATAGTELWSREDASPSHAPVAPQVLTTPSGLVAVDPRSGDPQWRRDGAQIIGGSEEALLVTEPDSGRVLRLDVDSGEALWEAPLPADRVVGDAYGTWAQVSAGVAYVSQATGDVPGGLLAVDVETGEIQWSRSFRQARSGPGLTGRIHPDDRLLVALLHDDPGDAELVALERDTGRTRWTTSLDDSRGAFGIRQTDELVLVPRENELAAHDADTGELAWRIEGEGLHPVSVDPLLLAEGDTLYRLDPAVPEPSG